MRVLEERSSGRISYVFIDFSLHVFWIGTSFGVFVAFSVTIQSHYHIIMHVDGDADAFINNNILKKRNE